MYFKVIFLFLIHACHGQTFQNLPNLKNSLLTPPITVSGFSSGGGLATQLHVTYSSIFNGMGCFSSVFYRCGPTGSRLACVANQTAVSRSIADSRQYEKDGKIDSLANLQNSKIFVWSGLNDTVVPTAVTKKVVDFYSNFTAASNIRFVSQPALHEFPTDYTWNPVCPNPTLDFIGNCAFDGPYEMLKTLLGSSVQKASVTLATKQLEYFNQAEFTSGPPSAIGLDESGYYYIPTSCTGTTKCKLHVFLHPCSLGNQDFQPIFVQRTGYLRLAEKNNIIMLFPRASANSTAGAGCWDNWAAYGDNYANKFGVQIVAIRKMISRLYGEF